MRAFQCQCGKIFTWKPEKAGKHATCPGCKTQITIPQLQHTFEHNPQPTIPLPNLCPACEKPLQPNAVICIECGYNTKTGKQLTTKVQDPPKKTIDEKLEEMEQEIDQEDAGAGTWILKAAGFFATLTMVIIWKLTGISFIVAVAIGVIAIPIMSILYLLLFGLISAPFVAMFSKKNKEQ
ncbi:MAG: EI24 domain-containing protein [Sedimentisphaerales bacterium]|nr:EI24 domain-containing protein [Sedimentisphaerales bacterium]